MNDPPRRHVLLTRCGGRTCAFPVEDVVETLRPLPVSPLAGTPSFVSGAAVVRGEPIPVVDLAAFLGDAPGQGPARLVVVRCGARNAALAVDAVVGVTEQRDDADPGAPLLASACGGAIEALGATGRELLLVLRAARIVPDDAWRAIEERA